MSLTDRSAASAAASSRLPSALFINEKLDLAHFALSDAYDMTPGTSPYKARLLKLAAEVKKVHIAMQREAKLP